MPKVTVALGLSICAMFFVIVLGYFFAELKADQEITNALVEETNDILRDLTQEIRERE